MPSHYLLTIYLLSVCDHDLKSELFDVVSIIMMMMCYKKNLRAKKFLINSAIPCYGCTRVMRHPKLYLQLYVVLLYIVRCICCTSYVMRHTC